MPTDPAVTSLTTLKTAKQTELAAAQAAVTAEAIDLQMIQIQEALAMLPANDSGLASLTALLSTKATAMAAAPNESAKRQSINDLTEQIANLTTVIAMYS